MKVISEISVVSTLQDYQRFYRADPYSVHPRKVRSIESIYNIANNNGWEVKELNCLVTEPLFKSSGIERNVNGEVIAVKPGALSDDFLIDFSKCAKETEEEYMKAGLRQLQDEDIILLADAHAEGYIGYKTSIIRLQKNQKAMLLGHLIKVRPNKKEINPYYLLAYLNSEPARHFLNYSVRGQTVGLHASDAGKLPVLLPPRKIQDSIGNKLKQALEAKMDAEKKRKEIEGIFERNLGNIEVRKLGGYVFKLSYCLEAGRLDPHFYYPEFLKVLDLLNNSGFEIKRMSELVEFSKETTNPSNTTQFVYVEIADVDLRYGFISSHSIVKGSNAPSRARKIIREGALLIPLTRPYRGAIAVVDSRYNDAITTTGFSVSYPKSDSLVDSYYLCAFLKSPYGLIQLIQRMSNANYPAILEDDISDILVPILPNDIKTVSDNMKEIMDNLLLSKQLHSQAMEELNKLLGLNAGGDKS